MLSKILAHYTIVSSAKDRYLQMFKGSEDAAAPIIDWAMKVLVRQDRVVWYLKRYIEDHHVFDEKSKATLAHFMSMIKTVPALDNIKFDPNDKFKDTLKNLKTTEKEAIEKLKGKERLVMVEPEQGFL